MFLKHKNINFKHLKIAILSPQLLLTKAVECKPLRDKLYARIREL